MNSKTKRTNLLRATKTSLRILAVSTTVSLMTIGATISSAKADDTSEAPATLRTQPGREAKDTTPGKHTGSFNNNGGYAGRNAYKDIVQYPDNPVSIAHDHVDDPHKRILENLKKRADLPKEGTLLGQTQEEQPLSKNPETGLQENKLSRNHRLADSSIKSILVTSGYNLLKEKDPKKSEKMKEALRNFSRDMSAGNKIMPEMDALIKEIDDAKKEKKFPNQTQYFNLYESAHKAISTSPKNLRIGDAERNQHASNAFDANLTKEGHLTARSGSIMLATLRLANSGAIPPNLALAATTSATYKNSDKNNVDSVDRRNTPVSSSTASEKAEPLSDDKQREIERLQTEFRRNSSPKPKPVGVGSRRSGADSSSTTRQRRRSPSPRRPAPKHQRSQSPQGSRKR